MKSDIEIYMVLLKLEQQFQKSSRYESRFGDIQEAAYYEANAEGVTEAMIELFGWHGQQRLRNQAYDIQAEEEEGKANV